MTDEQFLSELQIRAFEDQIDGYPFGHPSRTLEFRPLVPFNKDANGEIKRQATLDNPVYCKFTPEQRRALLETEEKL